MQSMWYSCSVSRHNQWNYFYYYKVIMVFVFPTIHSYKCPSGSRIISYSSYHIISYFVVSSFFFFSQSLPKAKDSQLPSLLWKCIWYAINKLVLQLFSYARGYILLRYLHSKSSLKSKARGGSCAFGDKLLSRWFLLTL